MPLSLYLVKINCYSISLYQVQDVSIVAKISAVIICENIWQKKKKKKKSASSQHSSQVKFGVMYKQMVGGEKILSESFNQ